ncbi:hypothetical protein TD95_005223, partial [Thielaviopsis punctulata]
ICPIVCKFPAAIHIVGETYKSLDTRSIGGDNHYTLARIGCHDVVVVCVCECGTLPAAAATKTVRLTFPNIEFYLLVGIFGGVPSEADDIRLNDIVVSYPNGQSPGVIKHDLGKIDSGGFVRTRILNKPHKALLNVVNKLKACLESINKASKSTYPLIHYGTIASGDQVIKNEAFRDDTLKEDSILCFKMEAAGLSVKRPRG